MGWNDFYRRRDDMDTVLQWARADPEAPLALQDAPTFASTHELLGALHHRWRQLLAGQLRTELTKRQETDHLDAVARAWRTAVRKHRTLRAVLDANATRYPDVLTPMDRIEATMLALTAGLAEPDEASGEVAEIGAGFRELLRSTPSAPAPRGGTVGELLRKLTPSA